MTKTLPSISPPLYRGAVLAALPPQRSRVGNKLLLLLQVLLFFCSASSLSLGTSPWLGTPG